MKACIKRIMRVIDELKPGFIVHLPYLNKDVRVKLESIETGDLSMLAHICKTTQSSKYSDPHFHSISSVQSMLDASESIETMDSIKITEKYGKMRNIIRKQMLTNVKG